MRLGLMEPKATFTGRLVGRLRCGQDMEERGRRRCGGTKRRLRHTRAAMTERAERRAPHPRIMAAEVVVVPRRVELRRALIQERHQGRAQVAPVVVPAAVAVAVR